MSKIPNEEIPVRASSGNIFADLGQPDAEEALARARLAQQIMESSMKVDPQQIASIIESRAAAIETLDNDIMMETVGVVMALDELRESLDKVTAHLDEGFEVQWNKNVR